MQSQSGKPLFKEMLMERQLTSCDSQRAKRRRYLGIAGSSVLALMAFSSVARADDSFSATLTPYLWFAGINGKVGARDVETNIDKCFTDIVDQADSVFGLFGRVDLRYGPFGFYVDGGWTRMVVEGAITPRGSSTFTGDMTDIDFAAMYRIGRWPADQGGRGVSLDALVGGRYFDLSNKFELDSGGTVSDRQDWIDVIVGGESAIDFDSHWRLMLHGDIGGFGINAQLTWSAAAMLAYRFPIGNVDSSMYLGYKAISENYTNSGGVGQFKWDAIVHGPVIGMTFTF